MGKNSGDGKRVIISFAFPIVILTSCVVAFCIVAFIPGFTLALVFYWVALYLQPDAISALHHAQRESTSDMVSVLEGESLSTCFITIVFPLCAGCRHHRTILFLAGVGSFPLIVMGTL